MYSSTVQLAQTLLPLPLLVLDNHMIDAPILCVNLAIHQQPLHELMI
jgi:hypothetical protein